jgi:putative transposase
MGRSRYKIIEPQQPHFVTLTVLHWIPIFTRPATVEILLDSLRFLVRDGLTIYAWVALENHCHFVLQSNALDKDIARLKSWTAKNLIKWLSIKKRIKMIGVINCGKKVCILNLFRVKA